MSSLTTMKGFDTPLTEHPTTNLCYRTVPDNARLKMAYY